MRKAESGRAIGDGPNAGKDDRDHGAGEQNEGTMPLSGHLRELRNRLIVVLIVLVAFMCIGLYRADWLVDQFLSIGEKYGYQFVYIAPQELLLEYFQVAFIFAMVITLPVILYEVYAFASPGLKKKEKSLFILAMVFGVLFAMLGILFAYKVLLPFMLYFLIDLSRGTQVRSSISVQNYVSFLMTVFIIFAIIFELPVVSVILTQLGIVKVAWMKKFRKFVIVGIFLLAAIITPPDVASQIMVALPMLVLYEFSIWICSLFDRVRNRKAGEGVETEAE